MRCAVRGFAPSGFYQFVEATHATAPAVRQAQLARSLIFNAIASIWNMIFAGVARTPEPWAPVADRQRRRAFHVQQGFRARGDLGLGTEGGNKRSRIERNHRASSNTQRRPDLDVGERQATVEIDRRGLLRDAQRRPARS